MVSPAFGGGNPPLPQPKEVVALDGGRRLDFLGTFSSEKDVDLHRSFWKRAFDVIAGPPEYHRLVRPYGVATDSQGRILVTDPGADVVHVFDFTKKKYQFLLVSPFLEVRGTSNFGNEGAWLTRCPQRIGSPR